MNTLPRPPTELAEYFIGPIVYQERLYFYDRHEANFYDPILDIYTDRDEFIEMSMEV